MNTLKKISITQFLLTIIIFSACNSNPNAQYETVYAKGQEPQYFEDNTNPERIKDNINSLLITDDQYVVEMNYTSNNSNDMRTIVTQAIVKEGYIYQLFMTNNTWLKIQKNNTQKIDVQTRECTINGIQDLYNCKIKVL